MSSKFVYFPKENLIVPSAISWETFKAKSVWEPFLSWQAEPVEAHIWGSSESILAPFFPIKETVKVFGKVFSGINIYKY